jgi:hypothetical protein
MNTNDGGYIFAMVVGVLSLAFNRRLARALASKRHSDAPSRRT